MIYYLIIYILGSLLYYFSVKKIITNTRQLDYIDNIIIIIISLLSWLTFLFILIQRTYSKFKKHE